MAGITPHKPAPITPQLFFQPITLRNDGEDPVFDPSVVHFAHELCK